MFTRNVFVAGWAGVVLLEIVLDVAVLLLPLEEVVGAEVVEELLVVVSVELVDVVDDANVVDVEFVVVPTVVLSVEEAELEVEVDNVETDEVDPDKVEVNELVIVSDVVKLEAEAEVDPPVGPTAKLEELLVDVDSEDVILNVLEPVIELVLDESLVDSETEEDSVALLEKLEPEIGPTPMLELLVEVVVIEEELKVSVLLVVEPRTGPPVELAEVEEVDKVPVVSELILEVGLEIVLLKEVELPDEIVEVLDVSEIVLLDVFEVLSELVEPAIGPLVTLELEEKVGVDVPEKLELLVETAVDPVVGPVEELSLEVVVKVDVGTGPPELLVLDDVENDSEVEPVKEVELEDELEVDP